MVLITRGVLLLCQNQHTFSDETWPTKRNLTEFPTEVKRSMAKKRVCKKWNSKFWSDLSSQNKWTTSRGDPKYSTQKKLKWTFPFDCQQKFQESFHRHKWKTPAIFMCWYTTAWQVRWWRVFLSIFSAECTIGMVRGLTPLKHYGTMALWRYGAMALWRYGAMALWHYGTMAIRCKL